jgi:hypothetical protein
MKKVVHIFILSSLILSFSKNKRLRAICFGELTSKRLGVKFCSLFPSQTFGAINKWATTLQGILSFAFPIWRRRWCLLFPLDLSYNLSQTGILTNCTMSWPPKDRCLVFYGFFSVSLFRLLKLLQKINWTLEGTFEVIQGFCFVFFCLKLLVQEVSRH